MRKDNQPKIECIVKVAIILILTVSKSKKLQKQ